jgi:hypothetical protein
VTPASLAEQAVAAARGGDVNQAIRLLECAIAAQPGESAWYSSLAALYRISDRLDDALNAATQAVDLDPTNADYLGNLSLVLTDFGEREQAIACLLRALGFNPEHANAHLALAQNLLAQGEMPAGWLEYEWRLRTEPAPLPRITSAPWNGMRLPTGRILLIGDQGYGDTIQFARYIPAVAARCEEVILGCSAELLPLLRRIPGVAHADHLWDRIPPHAAHCRLSSLPFIFQTASIPWPGPYLFADPVRVAAWDKRLPRGARRIGLAWRGRPTHPDDRRRSVSLQQLLPLAAIGECTFVSLQKPFTTEDEEIGVQFSGLCDLSEELTDFGETAAVIAMLDLVITVDSAVAHLAGAMDKPTWILLPGSADWRWGIGRSESDWYPSARLFRQRWGGDWDGVVAQVASALEYFR